MKRGISYFSNILIFTIITISLIPIIYSGESLNQGNPNRISDTYQGIDSSGQFVLFADEKSSGGMAYKDNNGWRYRFVMNQPIIGKGKNADFDADFGYIYMLNFRPTFQDWIPAINAKDQIVTVKHPYTNNSLVCEVNFTEYDVGDVISVYFTWYRNSSNWYNNSEIVLYNETSQFETKYNVQFQPWTTDNETINVSSTNETFFSVNTTDIGNIEPEDTNHFELWKCSVRLFDQIAYSWNWINSTPIMIYNHKPDYNENMPTYYNWTEDTDYWIDLGSNFSDIDADDINWYINYTSDVKGRGYVHPSNITIIIDNVTGMVHLIPHANITGIMYINFTAVDNNHTVTNHTGTETGNDNWYLNNDYGQTTTNLFLLNITQVNDPPWASDVYIDPAQPSYTSTLTCNYNYNDIEYNPENTTATAFKWYINDEGISTWQEIIGETSQTLDSSNFDLDDAIICSVRVKDIYFDYPDWGGSDKSLWALNYVNSSYVIISLQEQQPAQENEIIIGVG